MSKWGQAGWTRDLPDRWPAFCSAHWLLLCIWGHLGPRGFLHRALAGGPPGRAMRALISLAQLDDTLYISLHFLVLPGNCLEVEIHPGHQLHGSLVGLWMVQQTYLLHTKLNFQLHSFISYKLKKKCKKSKCLFKQFFHSFIH